MPGVEWGRLEKQIGYANYIRSVNYNLSRYTIFMDIYGNVCHFFTGKVMIGVRKKHILMVRFDVQSLCTWDDDDYYYCCYCYGEYYG